MSYNSMVPKSEQEYWEEKQESAESPKETQEREEVNFGGGKFINPKTDPCPGCDHGPGAEPCTVAENLGLFPGEHFWAGHTVTQKDGSQLTQCDLCGDWALAELYDPMFDDDGNWYEDEDEGI